MRSEEMKEYFMQEGCADLALALHRRTGYTLAVLFDDGQLDDWGSGREPTPAHAFVIDPRTWEAIDVKGRRPIAEVRRDFHDLIEPRLDDNVSEQQLLGLMGDRRPFYGSDEEVRRWAEQAISAFALGA